MCISEFHRCKAVLLSTKACVENQGYLKKEPSSLKITPQPEMWMSPHRPKHSPAGLTGLRVWALLLYLIHVASVRLKNGSLGSLCTPGTQHSSWHTEGAQHIFAELNIDVLGPRGDAA